MVLATVPDAPPTRKKQRATSWPAPISAKVPYFFASRLIWSAFWLVSSFSVSMRNHRAHVEGNIPKSQQKSIHHLRPDVAGCAPKQTKETTKSGRGRLPSLLLRYLLKRPLGLA